MIAIGASHGAHRQRATQLVAGVVCGLAVADVIIHFIGTGAPQLAIMVILAMSVAVLLNGSELVISEAARLGDAAGDDRARPAAARSRRTGFSRP